MGVSFDANVDGSWVHIGEVIDIAGPNLTTEEVEVTNHDSAGGYREYIAGLKDGGSISISGNFVGSDDGQQQMLADQKVGTVRGYRMILPDATAEADRTRWMFDASISDIGFTYPAGEAMQYSAEFKISGEPELYDDYTASSDVDGTNSSATSTDGTDGTATITMTVHDDNGDPVTGLETADFAATIDTADEATFDAVAELGAVTYDAEAGTYSVVYTNTAATYTFTNIKADTVVIQTTLDVIITSV